MSFGDPPPAANQKSPAEAANDRAFIDYCRECEDEILSLSHQPEQAVQELVAEKTARLVAKWRMGDNRYLECQPDAMYGSYLLHMSEAGDFCVALDVFMPGQAAWIHNHLCWCLFACLEGSERERLYRVDPSLDTKPEQTEDRVCPVGRVRTIGSSREIFHQVECASDVPTVSLHVYGADIGRLERDMWDTATNRFVRFKSGYSNEVAGVPVYNG